MSVLSSQLEIQTPSRATCPITAWDQKALLSGKLSFKRAGSLQSRDMPYPTADTGIGWAEFWEEEA